MKKFCLSCGTGYEYNASNPLGATSSLCPLCQKKNSRLNKKLELLSISGNGEIRCRCCGYAKFSEAIIAYPIQEFLKKPDPDLLARKSVLLCLNCESAIKNGSIKIEIKDSKSYPVEVSFYSVNVVIETSKLEDHLLRKSDDAIEMEVVNEKTTEEQFRNVSGAKT